MNPPPVGDSWVDYATRHQHTGRRPCWQCEARANALAEVQDIQREAERKGAEEMKIACLNIARDLHETCGGPNHHLWNPGGSAIAASIESRIRALPLPGDDLSKEEQSELRYAEGCDGSQVGHPPEDEQMSKGDSLREKFWPGQKPGTGDES